MADAIFKSIRFLHPDVDVPAIQAGLRVSQTGGLQTAQGHESVRQSLLMLLATRPGERVMRPHYGCDLHKLTFAPNDATTAGLAIHFVRTAVERWEKRVQIVSLDAGRDAHRESQLNIMLEYKVRATQRVDHLQTSYDLAADGR
jgi:phage baseplate assembly protein W